tara:strand:- start:11458 stop:11841 length:384 start_codon:yes stop_codon:yes gene_type:complete
MQPIKTLFYEFGEIELYDTYLITTMKQGITVIPEYNHELVKLANSHFAGKYFGYITHRKNSYAVDPSVYYKTSEIENLAAFAVVSKNPIAEQTVAVEKIFLDKPFQLFSELDSAITWVTEVVKMQHR